MVSKDRRHLFVKWYSVVLAGSVANFYSPLESLAGSDDEEEGEEENSQISQDSGIRIPRREQHKFLTTSSVPDP